MSFREWVQLIDGMCGLTLEEWKTIRDEIDQHFGVKCMRVSLNEADVQEIARLVAMRMEMYEGGADDAPRQTRMTL